jgi:hypothetical protein
MIQFLVFVIFTTIHLVHGFVYGGGVIADAPPRPVAAIPLRLLGFTGVNFLDLEGDLGFLGVVIALLSSRPCPSHSQSMFSAPSSNAL